MPKTEITYTWRPPQIAGLDPVNWNTSRPDLVKHFRHALRKATGEKYLQDYFEENPVALLLGLVRPHSGWVIPRPRLPLPRNGGGVPDFVVCEWSSIGPRWIIVELESPTRSPLTKAGVSAICNHAAEQINDYRTYLGAQALYLRANGWPEIHGECEGVIVIGRRTEPPPSNRHTKKLAAFRRQDIEVMSYDRLLQSCTDMQAFVEVNQAVAKQLSASVDRKSSQRVRKDTDYV